MEKEQIHTTDSTTCLAYQSVYMTKNTNQAAEKKYSKTMVTTEDSY